MEPAGIADRERTARESREGLDRLRDCPVYIETYGCRYNFGDTARLIEVLRHQGCTIAGDPGDADAVIVNTCTVVGQTERRMLRRLAGFRDRDLYVTGCMPAIQRGAILAVCSPVFLDPDTIRECDRALGTVSAGGIGIVQISRGCSGRCTYCITRLARGPLVSFPADEILAQARAFVRAGAVEIQLTAQDVSAWGTDSGQTLTELLEALDRIPGNHRFRVGMMNPATVKGRAGEIAKAFCGDHIFRFIHMPVQSGSDTVLGRMGRGYTVAEFEEIVAVFRKHLPGLTVSTDMIVGFCGETEADFTASLDLIRRITPAKVNVTRYSRRPFTPFAREKDFPDEVKKTRSRAMHRVAGEVYRAVNAAQIGRSVPFIVTETLREGSVMARSPAYTGIVLCEDLPTGTTGTAILKQDRNYFFIGEAVEKHLP